MNEAWGVLAAVLSSGLGGTSVAATRYLVNAIDPLAIGSFRFGIGFLLLLPAALLQGLASAPPGAWRGDLLMIAAALCMALYSIWSKPFIARSGPIPFRTVSMGVGAVCLVLISYWRGSFAPVAAFEVPHWLAALYLGAFGSALTFYLWAFALARTTPTRVAISVTVNPITASLVGAALLDEPLRWNLVGGIVTVFAGIWIATTAGRRPAPATQLSRAPID